MLKSEGRYRYLSGIVNIFLDLGLYIQSYSINVPVVAPFTNLHEDAI